MIDSDRDHPSHFGSGTQIFELVSCDELSALPPWINATSDLLLATGAIAVDFAIRSLPESKVYRSLWVMPNVLDTVKIGDLPDSYSSVCAAVSYATDWSKRKDIDIEGTVFARLLARRSYAGAAIATLGFAFGRFSWSDETSLHYYGRRWLAKVLPPTDGAPVTCHLAPVE